MLLSKKLPEDTSLGAESPVHPFKNFQFLKYPLVSTEEHRGDYVREQTVRGTEIRTVEGRKQREDCWGVK